MRQSDCAARDAIDQIEIKSPCTVSWDEMRPSGGDGRVRFCGQCRQNVYNVEAMSRGEAHRLIAVREGRVCVRILRRPDGTVVTADCWARLRAARRRGLLPFVGMLLLVGFTELIAIGAGLARLEGMLGGPPPAPPRVSLPIARGLVAPVPAIRTEPPRSPPEHEMGEKGPPSPRYVKGHLAPPPPVKRHYLMGKMAAGPTEQKSADAVDFLGGL
ncbi:MAG TPA: hypothetical protein VGP64_15690 [Polyangia bacterium]|jgi:hypothetical protein